MIAGVKISKALEKLMAGSDGYDPAGERWGDALPVTMRDLIEWRFDGHPCDLGECDEERLSIRIEWPDAPQTLRSAKPVRCGDLKDCRPIGPPNIKGDDYRGLASLASSFYKWLEINKPDALADINVDHRLSDHSWDLLIYFDRVFMACGGDFEEAFPQEGWARESGDPQDYSWAVLPMYELEGWDHTPVVEFLGKFIAWGGGIKAFHFPEGAYQVTAPIMADQAEGVLFNILNDGELELLGGNWQKALECLRDYPLKAIGSEDIWSEASVTIERAEHITSLFKETRIVRDMRKEVDPLIDEFTEDSEKFWKKFLGRLHVIATENPSLAANVGGAKALIEVLA